MACGTTAIWRLMATSHILLHVLETSLQLHSAVSHMTAPPDVTSRCAVGVAMACLLALSSGVTNAASAWATYRGQDFTAQRPGGALCAALHLLQLGPVWRYFRLVVVGDWTDVQELMRLRALQVALQNPGYLVLQGGLLLATRPPQSAGLPLGVAVSFASLVFSYTCCSHTAGSALTFVTEFEARPQSVCRVCSRTACSALRLALRILRHAFLLGSRLLAMVLLALVWRAWVLLLVAAHLLLFYFIYLLWSVLRKHKLGHGSIAKRMTGILLFGYVEVFDYTGQLYHLVRPVLAYYTAVLVENSSMGLIWYFMSDETSFNDTLLVLVFTLFILGVMAGVLGEQILCRHRRPALHDGHKEENNNLDSITSNESSPPNVTVAFDEPVDFDLDLNDILFASTKYNPKAVGDVMLHVLPTEIQSSQPEQELGSPETAITSSSHGEALHEVQTSSDSGFVSRLVDTSLSLENDSEGYSRCVTTPSLNSSTLCGTIVAKEHIVTSAALCKAVLHTSPGSDRTVLNTSPASLHTAISLRLHPLNSVKLHRLRKLSHGKAASTSVIQRVGHAWVGRGDYGSEGTSRTSSSSCGSSRSSGSKLGQVRLPHRKPIFSRSRSVPHTSGRNRENPKHIRRFHPVGPWAGPGPRPGLGLGPHSGSCPGSVHLKENHSRWRSRPELRYPSSSSDTTSDSFVDSYRRQTTSTSTSTSSDSQSLSDSEFGLTRNWPPGHGCSIVNIADLPLEQMPAKEHVLRWIDSVVGNYEAQVGTASQTLSRDRLNSSLALSTHHRFDSFRDVEMEYIDSARDLTHMSDSGLVGRRVVNNYRTDRPRTVSESGAVYCRALSSGPQLLVVRKKRWFDQKILRRLSSLSGRKQPKMIIVNQESTHTCEPGIVGLESAV